MGLTDEQRKRVSEGLWVVNTALKEQGLARDKDLKQDALLWLCRCAQRYDPARGVKWTTYAYSSVFLYIKNIHSRAMYKEALRKRFETTAPTIDDSSNEYFAEVEYRRIYNNCTETEKRVLDLRYAGYTWDEVAEQTNCTYKQVRNVWDGIREKAKEIIRDD